MTYFEKITQCPERLAKELEQMNRAYVNDILDTMWDLLEKTDSGFSSDQYHYVMSIITMLRAQNNLSPECEADRILEFLMDEAYEWEDPPTSIKIDDVVYLLMKDEENGIFVVEKATVNGVGRDCFFVSSHNPPEEDCGHEIGFDRIGKDVFFTQDAAIGASGAVTCGYSLKNDKGE